MKILILETSSEKGCLLLAEKEQPVGWRPLKGGPELSQSLAIEVSKLLQGQGKVDLIAVGTGPGSYTGIRVGAALAKALAYGWGIPLLGFCSLCAFGPSPVLVDARSGGVYALLEDRPELISPQDPRLQTMAHICSPHPEILKKRICTTATWQETAPDPSLLAPLIYRQFLKEGAAPLALNYLNFLA